MSSQNEYYYGQGKVYLSTKSSVGQWRWIGDVSSLKINFEFEEQYSKRSIGGRLVNGKRYITCLGGNVTAKWFDRSIENLELLLRGKSKFRKQSWTQEQFKNIEKGKSVSLKNQNVRYVTVAGLNEGSDYIVNTVLGVVYFLVTPVNQLVTIEYDYSETSGIGLLHQEPTELKLRYEGVNITENGIVFVELYRLSLDPIDVITLIDDKAEFSNIETTLQLLPDLSKNSRSEFGVFGRIFQLSEFRNIKYNSEIIYDGSCDFVN